MRASARRRRPSVAPCHQGRAIEIAGEPLRLRADPARLEQALGNLLDNALRHGAGSVQIRARHADDRVEIHVTDAGDGLSEDFAAHAFERFRRGNQTHSGDGAGLGLAIVDAVARAHHGSTGADGADIWISLPT